MTIVCLGWGSLLWDPRDLPLASDWRHDGPALPIEFARQSNDGRITLVITPGAAPLEVFSATLDVDSLSRARDVLAQREGIATKFLDRSIGHWSAVTISSQPESAVIAEWAQQTTYTGVVWTALRPKFGESFVTPSCVQVLDYLGGLQGETRDRSEEYVRRTRPEVGTAYRREIEQVLGWIATVPPQSS